MGALMSSKRILLVNSHVKNRSVTSKMVSSRWEEPYPSVALLYLTAPLRKNNHDVFYLDIPAVIK